jgi:hypothetical protein
MSVDTDAGGNGFATVGPTDATLAGCQSITLEDGDLVVYSEVEDDAWIQSDDYVDTSLML